MKRNNIEKCKRLRKDQTDAEHKLWSVLRNRQLSGVKFRRQFPIGNYIVDFYSPEYKLGIEADGGQHYEDKGKRHDELRTRELNRYEVKIVRFSDLDILKNIEGVYERIHEIIENRKNNSPHLNPLPVGVRKKGVKKKAHVCA
ncbi:endonuclease domain-containing protein [Candidatus Omnitrophota bacterium]